MKLRLKGTPMRLLALCDSLSGELRRQIPGYAYLSMTMWVEIAIDPNAIAVETIPDVPWLSQPVTELAKEPEAPQDYVAVFESGPNALIQPYATLFYRRKAIRINLDGMHHLLCRTERTHENDAFLEALAALEDDMHTDYENGRDDKYPYTFRSYKDLQEEDPS